MNSDYFKFGVQAIRKVSSCPTFESLENDLNVAVSSRINVLKNNELLSKFHTSSEAYQDFKTCGEFQL